MTFFRRTVRASAPLWPLALLALSACITITPRTKQASAGATVIPNVPLQKWGIESCGAGSLSTVLQHYGDPTTMQQWDAALPKMRGGVLTVDMLIAARKAGYDAQLVTGTPAMIADEVRQGRPAILMLQVIDAFGRKFDFFHYIVVDGIDPERNLIRTQFGDAQGRWTTFERIEKAWSGGSHTAILIRPRAASDALRAAVALEDAGKYADAATAYRAIVSSHPENVIAWTNLGNATSHLGDRTAAEDAYRHALAADPNAADALNNLAWLLYEEKRYDEAETLARRAAGRNGPDKYMVLDTLAHVLAAKGSCAEAVTTFRAAIDAVPATQAAARGELEKALGETTASCRG